MGRRPGHQPQVRLPLLQGRHPPHEQEHGKPCGGCIVNTASVIGLFGNVGQANYGAAKAGVINLTKTFSKEYGKRKIRCNAVAPGFIKTKMTEVLSQEAKDKMAQMIPLQELGEAEDVAKAIRFLASDEARYITGQTLAVSGPFHNRAPSVGA